MSIRFAGTSTDGSYETNSSPILTYPFTADAWAWPANANVFKDILSIVDKDAPDQWLVRFALTNTGVVRCYARDSGTNDGGADSTTTYTAGTWHHAACTCTATGRSAYLNGGGKGTNAVAKAPTGVDRLAIGRAGDSTPSDPFTGHIAIVRIWPELTDVQIWRLSQGLDINVKPYHVFDLGQGSVYDSVRGVMLTPLGTPLSYPTPNFRPPQLNDWERQLWRYTDVPAAAAPGGGGDGLLWWSGYGNAA